MPSGKQDMWAEMLNVFEHTHAIAHRGEEADLEVAKVAVAVAETLLNELLPIVFGKLALKMVQGRIIPA